jgi:hypothetical protein
MTTYYLINPVNLGGVGLLWPGTKLNSAIDPITQIQSAGGTLVDSTNATVVAAAAKAQPVKAAGGDVSTAASIMVAAYSASNNAGVQGSAGAQGNQGSQGNQGAQGAV